MLAETPEWVCCLAGSLEPTSTPSPEAGGWAMTSFSDDPCPWDTQVAWHLAAVAIAGLLSVHGL